MICFVSDRNALKFDVKRTVKYSFTNVKIEVNNYLKAIIFTHHLFLHIMSAHKTILHEIDFFAYFSVQNSMVSIIVKKYVTKYQLFSIFRITHIFINIY